MDSMVVMLVMVISFMVLARVFFMVLARVLVPVSARMILHVHMCVLAARMIVNNRTRVWQGAAR